MKIINSTRVPSKLLRQVLLEAERFVGFDTSDVRFRFTRGWHTRATTYGEDYVRIVLPFNSRGWVGPMEEMHWGESAYVRHFYELMVHEIAHVVDYSNKVPDMYGRSRKASEDRAYDVAMNAYAEFQKGQRENEKWVREFVDWVRKERAIQNPVIL